MHCHNDLVMELLQGEIQAIQSITINIPSRSLDISFDVKKVTVGDTPVIYTQQEAGQIVIS